MTTLIVVPMKDPGASKTRLAEALDAAARAALARHLYARTLAFLGPVAAQAGAHLAVVTASEEAAGIARRAGVRVLHEPDGAGLSGAAHAAATWAERQGYARLCIVPADLAAPSEADMARLLASEAEVTICPSLDLGTNALLVALPSALPFRYGPRSALRHREEAEARGLRCALMPLTSLRHDIDTGDCLRRAMAELPELEAIAG